jgi:hypothetical protein
MKISMDATTYTNFQEVIVAQIENLLRLAEGGQLLTHGTDIQNPGLVEREQVVVAKFEAASAGIGALIVTLKQNFAAPGAGLSRSAP